MTPKQEAWKWCSLYIRHRDALEYQAKFPETDFGWVKCCTCDRIIHIKKNADAGHYIDRGSGGLSGVYFDERNIHTQCKPCNASFYVGRDRPDVKAVYDKFMLEKYGQETIDVLHFLDKNQSYKHKILGIGLMYKKRFKEIEVKCG